MQVYLPTKYQVPGTLQNKFEMSYIPAVKFKNYQ